MGELNGPFSFSGRIGDVVSYRLGDKQVVRSIGSTQRTHDHPATRRSKSVFGLLSEQNKFFRDTLSPYLHELHRKKLDTPVQQLFSAIHALDPAPKESRTLTGGLSLPEGRSLLEGFEFNHSPTFLRYLLSTAPEADTATGTLCFRNFAPLHRIKAPVKASHALLSSCLVRLDFERREGELAVSTEMRTELSDQRPRDILLRPERELAGPGIYLLLLKVVFTEYVNGEDRLLAGAANGCAVVRAFSGPMHISGELKETGINPG
jgi:hypothetical protein